MRVLVIGATGKTGRHAMKLLLERGHQVTAFARRPAAIEERSDRLRIVHGDARDPGSFDPAVNDQDAVLSAFGPPGLGRTDVQEVFMRNLVGAMARSGVKRLVNLAVWGSGGGAVPPSNPVFRFFFVPVVLRHVLADKRRGEVYLFQSDLDYTNVCPAFLKNAPARGGVRASLDGKGLKQVMHREDLAGFMVDQLASREWIRKNVTIGY